MAARHSSQQMSQILGGQPEQSNKNEEFGNRSSASKTYYAHAHTSPYVDGKRNAHFAHPSLVSNQVFYSDNNSNNQPKNNNRRSSLRNDQNDYDYREERNWESRPATSQQERRDNSYRDGQPSYTNQKANYYESDNYRSVEHYDNNRNRKESDHIQEDRYRSAAGIRSNQGHYERDDRSESSNLSSANYICPNCLNRHLSEDQRNLCRRQREEDMEKERRITDYNSRVSREEEDQERQNRSKRVNDARGLKESLEQGYYEKLENRRSPKKESVSSPFQNVFDKQDELVKNQKNTNQAYRAGLQDQMRQQSHKKNQEREWNSSRYGTSLQIGEGYHNRYLEGRPSNLSIALKDQVEEKAYVQRREREADKRLAQERSEQALREQEEEEQRRKDKEWHQKRELKDQLLRTIEDKKNKQREELASRQAERSVVDQSYAEYKRRQVEEEARAKNQLFDFGKALKDQQGHSSYKKLYEDRKNQKETTSFDPPTKTKRLYPCGDCHIPYEKAHLTKY